MFLLNFLLIPLNFSCDFYATPGGAQPRESRAFSLFFNPCLKTRNAARGVRERRCR